MDKKIIDIQENIIDTQNFLPEAEQAEKVTYKQEKPSKLHRVKKTAPKDSLIILY